MTDIITETYERLTLLLATGDDTAAHKYLLEQYPHLPERVQRQIALATFTKVLRDEVRERDTITDIQKHAMQAIEILEREKGLADAGAEE